MKSFRMIGAGLSVAALLSACMPSSIMVLPDPTDDAQLISAGNGVLAVQVADTTPFGISVPINQLTLAPKDVNEEDESQFPRMMAVEDTPGQSSKIFYAVLPANDYSIRSLRSYHQFGEAYFSRFYPAGIELGTFTVEPGKVTDLGILAVYIRRSGEDYQFETVRAAGKSRVVQSLMSNVPGLAGRIENLEAPATWHDDANDRERRNDYVNAVNRQIVFADPYVDSTNGVLRFPSRLGVIVQRNAPGDWSLDAVPRDEELRAVTRVRGQDLAITEFGDLLARSDDSESWRELELPPGGGSLVYLGDHPATGIYAVIQHESSAAVWTAAELGGRWQPLVSVERTLGIFESIDKTLFAIDQGLDGASYASQGNFLYLALGKDMYQLDLRTHQVHVLDTPNPSSVQIRNGIMTVRTDSTFSSSRVSFDDGASWQSYAGKLHDERRSDGEEAGPRRLSQRYRRELRPAKIIGHPVFLDSQHGYAIHKSLKDNERPFLIETENGADTWHARTASPLPDGCSRLVLASSDELLLGCFLSGEFYRSIDGGENWQLDRNVSES